MIIWHYNNKKYLAPLTFISHHYHIQVRFIKLVFYINRRWNSNSYAKVQLFNIHAFVSIDPDYYATKQNAEKSCEPYIPQTKQQLRRFYFDVNKRYRFKKKNKVTHSLSWSIQRYKRYQCVLVHTSLYSRISQGTSWISRQSLTLNSSLQGVGIKKMRMKLTILKIYHWNERKQMFRFLQFFPLKM